MQYRIFKEPRTNNMVYHVIDKDQRVVNYDNNKDSGMPSCDLSNLYREWIFNILVRNNIYLSFKNHSEEEHAFVAEKYTGVIDHDAIIIPDSLMKSCNNCTYFLTAWEGTRSWAILFEVSIDGKRKAVMEGPPKSVFEKLLEGNFIRTFDIDYQLQEIADQSFWRNR